MIFLPNFTFRKFGNFNRLVDVYGNTYVGEFKKGRRHGKGTQTEEETTYIGEWKRNMRHGQGTYP
jgi:hypothetical protein